MFNYAFVNRHCVLLFVHKNIKNDEHVLNVVVNFREMEIWGWQGQEEWISKSGVNIPSMAIMSAKNKQFCFSGLHIHAGGWNHEGDIKLTMRHICITFLTVLLLYKRMYFNMTKWHKQIECGMLSDWAAGMVDYIEAEAKETIWRLVMAWSTYYQNKQIAGWFEIVIRILIVHGNCFDIARFKSWNNYFCRFSIWLKWRIWIDHTVCMHVFFCQAIVMVAALSLPL